MKNISFGGLIKVCPNRAESEVLPFGNTFAPAPLLCNRSYADETHKAACAAG